MRIIFLNCASTETRMRLVVLVLYFSRDCKAGCSYFHGALLCLHSPILRSDTSTIVITAGETVRAVCFGVCRHLRVSLMFALLCVLRFFFVSLLHTTHLVHRCGKQWMRTKWCVCITPFVHLRYLPSSLLLLSFSSVFSVLSHFQSHHRRTFLLVFCFPITHQPDCVCWVQTVT